MTIGFGTPDSDEELTEHEHELKAVQTAKFKGDRKKLYGNEFHWMQEMRRRIAEEGDDDDDDDEGGEGGELEVAALVELS